MVLEHCKYKKTDQAPLPLQCSTCYNLHLPLPLTYTFINRKKYSYVQSSTPNIFKKVYKSAPLTVLLWHTNLIRAHTTHE